MTIKKESDMNQRYAFEKWAKKECCTGDKNGINFKRAKYNDGSELYEDASVETAWAAWQAATASQWQPIETAPKNGTSILAYTAEGQCEVSWDHGYWMQSPCYSTYDGCGSAVLLCDPTHWMPLPPEPAK